MTTEPNTTKPRPRPITDPDEIATLSRRQLRKRVRPLLRQAGLTDSLRRYTRLDANLRGVCLELAHAWKQDPTLTGSDKPVPFGDYLAARLATTLRDLDREQNPELYDRHRKYQGERDDIPLDQEVTAANETDLAWEDETELRTTGYSRNDPESFLVFDPASDPPSWPSKLQDALRAARIEGASQAALASALHLIAIGKTRSAYRFTRTLGDATNDARYHPATSAYLAALEVINIDPDDLLKHPVATAP